MATILSRTTLAVTTVPTLDAALVKAVVDFRPRWHAIFQNEGTSSDNITLIEYRRYAIPGGLAGPWVQFTPTVPTSPGSSESVRVDGDCSSLVEFRLTADGPACSVLIEVGGPPAGAV